MDKIMSAEEFAIGVFVKIYGFELNWIRTRDGKNGREAAIRFVRSRDKATVKRCREAIKNKLATMDSGNFCGCYEGDFTDEYPKGTAAVIGILDDVLRELGGE